GVDAVALADADDLAVEGHLIGGLGHVVFPLRSGRSRHDGRVVDWNLCWRGIAADVTAYTKRKAACVAASGPSLGRKRPRRAAIAGGGGGSLPHALAKTIAISGSIERR